MHEHDLLNVPGWEGHYFVCELCQRVYSKSKYGKMKVMKFQMGKEYLEIKLSRKINKVKRARHHLASRILLAAYTQTNLDIERDAHHKNGNRSDMSRNNLMWLTRKQNRSKYHKLGKANDELFDKQEGDPF